MDTAALTQEIDRLIADLGDETSRAKPTVERAVVEKIRLLLESTREQGAAREAWGMYLPYAANLCARLARLEPGWEAELEYFASENAQFWVDHAADRLNVNDIAGTRAALGKVVSATRLVKADDVLRVSLLLAALETAVELSEKKLAIPLYEEAEKVYRKSLLGSEQYTGSIWTGRIKKIGKQIEGYGEKLRRYFGHRESVVFTIEADSERDLERVIEALQESLGSRVKVTRRGKSEEGKKVRARVKVEMG